MIALRSAVSQLIEYGPYSLSCRAGQIKLSPWTQYIFGQINHLHGLWIVQTLTQERDKEKRREKKHQTNRDFVSEITNNAN
ncbi:hypothetical protein FKM82_025241 [Ascaphus truei]